MAERTDQRPSSSSSSTDLSNYDVFLSFSGADTRATFTADLYSDLNWAGIRTFMDEEELKKGDEIGPNLLKAIKESRISIPIFSLNYASSKWCLEELVQIMKSRETMGQTVFPIFLYVNPRDVRKQTMDFGEKFQQLAERSDKETVNSWKEAMKKAGELKGWHLQNVENGCYNGSVDSLAWRWETNGYFSVRSFYKELMGGIEMNHPIHLVWSLGAPPRPTTFCWIAGLDKILTCENLRKRGMCIISYCVMCGRDGENTDHLFLRCEVARKIWEKIFNYIGLECDLSGSLIEVITRWLLVHSSPKGKILWKLCFVATMWGIWKERNDRIFNNKRYEIVDIVDKIQRWIAWWAKEKKEFARIAIMDIWRWGLLCL